MKSELPKVLIPLAGRPMVEYVLDALDQVGFDQVALVVGYRADDVRATLRHRQGLTFVLQEQQMGTGHAVMVCREVLAAHDGPVAIVTGDAPMIQADSVLALLAEFERSRPACVIGTIHKDPAGSLGRIVRDAEGNFLGIVEEKDASEAERRLTEVNMSCYVFDSRALLLALEKLRPDNAQGEYYITDCPGLLRKQGEKVLALPVLKPIEALGVNTMDELAQAEEVVRAGLHVTQRV